MIDMCELRNECGGENSSGCHAYHILVTFAIPESSVQRSVLRPNLALSLAFPIGSSPCYI
jgi:hypothetical protein